MDWSHLVFWFVVALSYIYAFFSGSGDAANALATSIASRAINPTAAIRWGAFLQFLGALFGTGVALTISSSLVSLDMINLNIVFSAVLAMLIWTLLTYFFSIPVSDTHSLVGSLLGAAVAWKGFEVIIWSGVTKVAIAIIVSPILGLIGGYIFLHLISSFTHSQKTVKMRHIFKKLQVATAGFNSFSNGLNNAQKPMGLILMALVLYQQSGTKVMEVPFWLILSVALTQAVGVIFGLRLIKTVGMKISHLSPEQGFSAQFAAGLVMQIASLLGVPVSSTQVITSSIVGAGASRRVGSVRWQVVQEIGLSWLFTLPATIFLGYVISSLMSFI